MRAYLLTIRYDLSVIIYWPYNFLPPPQRGFVKYQAVRFTLQLSRRTNISTSRLSNNSVITPLFHSSVALEALLIHCKRTELSNADLKANICVLQLTRIRNLQKGEIIQ